MFAIHNVTMAAAFFNFLIPKNHHFFNLFNRAASNNLQMSNLLYTTVCSDLPHDEKMYFNQIARLKIIGNELKHEVYMASSRALISPFERNDMYALASAINHICDSIHISGRRISLYKLEKLEPAVNELSGIIIETCLELETTVRALGNMENAVAITEGCNKIKQLENYADRVYNKALSSIMTSESNSIELIKYTEILAALEKTTDQCEDATNVIESILVKNT
jgi:uncharacterized protein Yka (UPF0111/DUF47 family)